MDLIIVESPTKSKTVARFLENDYRVVATMGHIRDLPEKRLGVDIAHDFKPQYVMVPKKKETIDNLKAEAKKAKKIFIATDPDREGEAIAWHVASILGEDKETVARITFHEITKSAIERAMANPGKINLQLVDAQQARRILDRLVGYKLSPLLWYKIRRGLSAGRVQSVAVRLIVEREREIEKFVPVEYWEIFAELRRHIGGLKEGVPTFIAKLDKANGKTPELKNEVQAGKIVEELKQANYEVGEVEKKEVKRSPAPPFTTSTMQQRAATVLGFSSSRTMRAAQHLYEKGLITYHRTDSLNLAAEAVEKIRQYIKANYKESYLPENPRFYKTKSKVAQEAHEAIRPTDMNVKTEKFEDRDEEKLYDLVWKRALASQMNDAVFDSTKVKVQATSQKNIYILVAEGKVIKFPGWLAVYNRAGEQESERVKKEQEGERAGGQESRRAGEGELELPDMDKGDDLDLIKIDPQQKFTSPPARYTEATLIKTLEEIGIGRPSTYAPIVSTIQNRQYVEKTEGKFHPTSLGFTVNDFLVEYFSDIVDYQFTANMENELDDIANGAREWIPVIRDFYTPFEKKLSGVALAAERVAVPTEVTGEKCPECKEGMLVIRVGRFGKFISCSRFPKCKYTAPFTPKLENVKCPKCGGEIVIKKTKKGKQFYGCSHWPKCDWASWRKPK